MLALAGPIMESIACRLPRQIANLFPTLKDTYLSSTGNALGIWICGWGCSLFSGFTQSAGAHSTRSLKISGCKRRCPKDLRVRAPTAPVLTHSLTGILLWHTLGNWPERKRKNHNFGQFQGRIYVLDNSCTSEFCDKWDLWCFNEWFQLAKKQSHRILRKEEISTVIIKKYWNKVPIP